RETSAWRSDRRSLAWAWRSACWRCSPCPSPCSVVGSTRLLLGDELQQRWSSLLRLLDAAFDGRDDLVWRRDPLAVTAKRPGHVDRVQQVPDHAIGRKRRFVAREPGFPLGQPLVTNLADLVGDVLCAAALLAFEAVAHLLHQGAQSEVGIAQQGIFDGQLFVE